MTKLRHVPSQHNKGQHLSHLSTSLACPSPSLSPDQRLLCQSSADFNWDFKETATRTLPPSWSLTPAHWVQSVSAFCCAAKPPAKLAHHQPVLAHSSFHTLPPSPHGFLSPLGSTEINSNLWRHNKFHGLALKIKRRLENELRLTFLRSAVTVAACHTFPT